MKPGRLIEREKMLLGIAVGLRAKVMLLVFALAVVGSLIACADERTVEVPVDRPVIQTVEVEVAVEVEKEVIREVQVEVPVEVEREVVREVQVEVPVVVERDVVREVQVEVPVVVEREVVREVRVEVPVEQAVEVPVEVLVERTVEVPVEVEDDHEDHDDHMEEMGHEELIGRLLVTDGVEAHLSVIDLETDSVESGIFDIAGPNARIYPSLNHRYAFVLARGPEGGDDRIHIFDGGVYNEPHGDHFDLVTDPVSRHPLEIVEEWPVHSVNSNGWTTIFADTNGHALLFDEESLGRSGGDYEPTVLEAGIQHGTAFAITDEHVVMSVSNPLCTEFIPGTWDCLPLGAVVSDLDGEIVYDAASESCTFLHGEAYNQHGAFFGCQEGVLFIHEEDGQFGHEILPYPAELGEPGMSAIITYYWHVGSDNFFGIGNRRESGQAGVWLVDPVHREIREIFSDPSAAYVFSNDGETFFILADDGVLRAFDSHDGELIESVQVLKPFERVWGSPSPAMSVAGEWLFLSDPYSGRVLGVHLEHMEIEEEWELGGAPANLTFVGVGVDDHHDDEHAHEDEHDHEAEADHDDHEDHMEVMGHKELIGRLLVSDGVEAHLSVIDLSTDDVESGIFDVTGPNATLYSSVTHRYGIALARGPESGDDRIHIFDGGVFYVPHGDHFDLVTEPVSRHSLEIVEEWPVHSVNSHGWTTIFADTNGHVILIDEEGLASSGGDYEPIVLEAGIQHGTGFVISDKHVIMSVNNPLCTEFIPSGDCLPLGVEVRTFDDEVVYDAVSDACPSLHGEAHNAHGAVFGCRFVGVLFVHAHDGDYEHEFIPYPEDMADELALGLFYGHHDSENFFAPATLFPGGQCCDLGGVWLVDVENGDMREVFPDPSVTAAFSSDGETFYMLANDGVLRAFDSHDGELVETMQLIDPFESVFGSPSPSMIVVGEWLFLADPNSGHVLGVHLEHMEIEEEWELGGAPANLTFVGVGVDDHHDHEDDH